MLTRGLRWVREQVAFLAVLITLAAALLYLLVEPGRWGRTSGGIAVALFLAGVIRAASPSRLVGMLAIRSRVIDSITYLVLGGLILAIDVRLHG